MSPDRPRMAYYVPVDDVRESRMSLVDHAKRKLLYHELSCIYELAISRDTDREVEFIKAVIPASAAPVLDLGCGVGRHIGSLATRYGYQGIGVDLSDVAIDRAKAMWPSCQFEVQDFRDVRLRSGQAGAAVCMWSTFNYLSTQGDIDRFLRSISLALRPRGWLLIDLPNPRALKRGPYNRRSENTDYAVEVSVEKRQRGEIVEALYQYRITKKGDGSVYLATDQELNQAYEPKDVEQLLRPSFRLVATYGDYTTASAHDSQGSPRAILLLERVGH